VQKYLLQLPFLYFYPVQTFTKQERLCRAEEIDNLFISGDTLMCSPFRAVWLLSDKKQENPAQILIVAPKRNIAKAVDRNKIKRMIREAYRMNKATFYEALTPTKKHMQFALIYQLEKIVTYSVIVEKIKLVLLRLSKKI